MTETDYHFQTSVSAAPVTGSRLQQENGVTMMRIPHELQDEFPNETGFIARQLKGNYQFRRLASRYDEVNREIYRIESGDEPTTDEILERLKKRRLKLKDEVAGMLAKLERRM